MNMNSEKCFSLSGFNERPSHGKLIKISKVNFDMPVKLPKTCLRQTYPFNIVKYYWCQKFG